MVMGAGTALRAQNPFHVTQIDGFGGLGFDKDNTQSGGGTSFDTNAHDLSTELGLLSAGFLYDPRLLDYDLSAYWDGNNNAVDQGSAKSNGLSYNLNATFLPYGHYPLAFTFTQNHTNAYGSLITPFTTTTDNYVLHGEIKQPRFAMIGYDVGFGSTENGLATGPSLKTDDRYADVIATRDVFGWRTRFTDNYLDLNSFSSGIRYAQNILYLNGQRDFGQALKATLGANYSDLSLNGVANGGPSSTDMLQLLATLTWRHSEKLSSSFQASFSENASNTLEVVEAASGGNISLPFSPQSIKASMEIVSGTANYRLTHDLNLFATGSFSNNSIPSSQLSGQTTAVLATIATNETTGGGGYGYYHKIWKFAFDSAGSVMGQFFSTAAGTPTRGVGYNFANSLRGGNRRKAEIKLSYLYNTQSNPIFFNIVGTTDQHGDLDFRSDYFRFVSLQGQANLGRTTLRMAGTEQNLHSNSYSLTANFPKWKLHLFASKSDADSLSAYFQPGSTLLQPGGSTGGEPLPLALLTPLVTSYVATSRAGLGWRFRNNLEIDGSYSQQRFLFTTNTSSLDHFDQVNVIVLYKFGRFTLYGGYGRGLSEFPNSHEILSRYYVRVRFPFHVFGRG
jgi:hypothetical protein